MSWTDDTRDAQINARLDAIEVVTAEVLARIMHAAGVSYSEIESDMFVLAERYQAREDEADFQRRASGEYLKRLLDGLKGRAVE